MGKVPEGNPPTGSKVVPSEGGGLGEMVGEHTFPALRCDLSVVAVCTEGPPGTSLPSKGSLCSTDPLGVPGVSEQLLLGPGGQAPPSQPPARGLASAAGTPSGDEGPPFMANHVCLPKIGIWPENSQRGNPQHR